MDANEAGSRPDPVGACVEAICHTGCRSVRAIISHLEQGGVLPEVAGLSPAERRAVLDELRSIMAVYGDACRLLDPADGEAT